MVVHYSNIGAVIGIILYCQKERSDISRSVGVASF